MFPLAPSVIVIVPEFVPELVSKTRLCAPLEVIVASADPVPTTISPVPFGAIAKSMFESPPLAAINGSFPVAAFVTLISLTADDVVPKTTDSLPFASAIKPPSANFGAVKVLFVKVSVEEAVINPQSSMSGLVPSLAVA
jgi:hypothetical protein